MSFAKFLIEKWQLRPDCDLPMRAVEGRYYSTLTGSDPPSIEIDWEALERDIEELEAEFKKAKK